MLSFKEKNAVRKQIGEAQKQLSAEGILFKERNALRKQIGELLKKLNESAVLPVVNKDLEDLVAGKFDDLEPEAFLVKLKEITAAMGDEIESIKQPAISYIDKRLAA